MGRMSDVHIDMQETGDSAEVCLARAVTIARTLNGKSLYEPVKKTVTKPKGSFYNVNLEGINMMNTIFFIFNSLMFIGNVSLILIITSGVL